MRLLAVEARQNGSYNLDRYRQVASLGADLHVLNGEGIAGFWPAERYRIAGSARIADITDAAARWHAQVGFDGVLTFAESAIVATAAVAQALGLPGIPIEAAVASRNKILMHEAHGRAGAPHAQFRHAPSLADGLAAAERFGYPVVIKPVLGASSNFVFRIDSPAEFVGRYEDAAQGARTMKWARLEADGVHLGPDGVLVESFLDGSEHMIEAVVWDGDVCLASVVDRVDADQDTFEYNLHQAPTTLSADQLGLVHAALNAAAAGQGLRRSALHAEVRFHQGKPHILEVTPRPGGGGLEHMARVSAGYDPIAAHIDIACGRRPASTAGGSGGSSPRASTAGGSGGSSPRASTAGGSGGSSPRASTAGGYQPTGIFTAARSLPCAPGTITKIAVPVEVTSSPDLLFCRLVVGPGDVIKRPPDGNGILGFIGAMGTSHDEAMATAAKLADSISVTVED